MGGDFRLDKLGLLCDEPVFVQVEVCCFHTGKAYGLLVASPVHVDACLDTIFLSIGLVHYAEEQIYREGLCVLQTCFFCLSLGSVELPQDLCNLFLIFHRKGSEVDMILIDI